MKKYLLGIDVGTTGTKTLLFCEDGTLLGHAYRPYPTHTPAPGISEQNARDWYDALVATVREVCTDPEVCRNVVGISLSLQGGTMVAVDAECNPVRPAMVWSDLRCEAQMRSYLEEVGDQETMYQKTGWALSKGLNAMQIRWMKDNEPENFAKTHMFLSVPDYISRKLTGIPAVDPSDAGINQLMDIRSHAYDPALLAFAGITPAQLPRILDSGEVIGHLTEAAAEDLGLTTDCVLCAGAHDQYAVALGAGACEAGDILIGSGTCWVITAIGDKPDFDSGLAQSLSAVPGKWGSLWSLETGGVCLEWWRQLLADISGLPVRIPEVADLACVGAAILAGVGSGVFRDTAEGYSRLAVATETVLPDPEQSARLRPLLEQYKSRAAALGAVYGLK